ncbi:MAG TPA: c-type cytochrome [Candidatus Marinimicrobia bacterium]|nr:c-type cytochrome [Candidatus Neomarinimicrobiota bacterium]
MFKNDERYWDINQLNKWFGISSLIFLISMVWVFIDDNDDEFKIYQKEFRKLQIEITQKNLDKELGAVKDSREKFEERLVATQEIYSSHANEVASIEKALSDLQGKFYKANMNYQGQKAKVDEIKFLVESENVHENSHEKSHRDNYNKALVKLDGLKLTKENYEIEIKDNEEKLKGLNNELKKSQEELDFILRDVTIADGKLISLDRSRMSFLNRIGDIVRDLPILDFMDPYYKVNQIVVKDVHYDVNFTTMPVVDRCTSCHLEISNPDNIDAEQPFTTHPDLDLYLTSSSPHPLESFGCTSCHAGRSRGTSFVSSAHTPNSTEQKHDWEEKHDWEKIHHWMQPMFPKRYTQASCFKCHMNTSDLAGAEKLNLGLTLVDKAGCNSCHVAGNWRSSGKTGPDLRKINEKLKPDWVAKWIKNPRSFRYNTRMPSIFEQDNQTTEKIAKRNINEIASITHYLFNNKHLDNGKTINKYLGNPQNGEKIFQTVGCMGCHISETDASLAPSPTTFSNLTKLQGPNLVGMGSKVSAEWLYNWLKNPHDYMASTRMPNLRLSDQEAKDLTAFLLDSRIYEFDKLETLELDTIVLNELTVDWLRKMNPEKFAVAKASKMSTKEKLAFVGEKSIRHYGCFGCHNIDGFMDAKPIGTEITYQGSKTLDKLDFGLLHDIEHTNFAWIENKLRTPRIYDRGKESDPLDLLKMPNFYFTEDEIEAITTAILAFNTDGVGKDLLAHENLPKYNKDGHRLVKKYNCQGCHLIENRGGQLVEQIGPAEYGPPNLNTEGKKANPNWLLSFFNKPITIRPNIQVRMPSFHQINDKEWDTIIKYFQGIDDENIGYRADYIVNEKSTEFHAGEKLHELGACNNCHFYGTEFPIQTASTWAANLAMTKVRLNPDWVVEWLREPQDIMPGTKMPAPYIPTSDILDVDDAEATWGNNLVKLSGNQDAMLEGLRDYLWTIDGKIDISQEVKDYFEENGYDFSDADDEDEWDEEDW